MTPWENSNTGESAVAESLEDRLDRLWEIQEARIRRFRESLPPGSHTARSIDRRDTWSEIATWARRDGYADFAAQVDAMILAYNRLIPDFEEH